MGRPSLTVNLKSYFYFIFKKKKELVNFSVNIFPKKSYEFTNKISRFFIHFACFYSMLYYRLSYGFLGKRYGKRSDLVSIDYNQHKWKYPQCPTCGPPHLQMGPDAFRCFGPKLCCSPTKGCLHGESHGGARNCAYEDMNAAPCENHAKHCNSV